MIDSCNENKTQKEYEERLKNESQLKSNKPKQTEAEKAQELKNKYIRDSINYKHYFDNLKLIELNKNEDYQSGLNLLNEYIYIYNKRKNIAACYYLNNDFKNELIKKQVKFLPVLRAKFSNTMNEKLWEENIKVSGNNRTITFIGGKYASNKLIKQDLEAMNEILHTLRFKRINFKWIPSADEYTAYTLKTLNDNEIK